MKNNYKEDFCWWIIFGIVVSSVLIFSSNSCAQEQHKVFPIYNLSDGVNLDTPDNAIQDTEASRAENVVWANGNLEKVSGYTQDSISIKYETGTASVTTTGTSVIGTGTTWDASTNCVAGDVIQLEDKWYFIDSVTDDTTLVLDDAYTGDGGSGLSYKISNIAEGLDVFTKADGTEYLIRMGHGRVDYSLGGGDWTVIIDTLSTTNKIRGTTFNDKYIFGDGIFYPYSWDSTTLVALYDADFATHTAPKGNFFLAEDNKLFVSGVADNKSVLYWCEEGSETDWLATSIIEINADDSDVCTGLYPSPWDSLMFFFKEGSFYEIFPAEYVMQYDTEEDAYAYIKRSDFVGCVSDKTIQTRTDTNDIVWLAREGVYSFKPNQLTLLTSNIDALVEEINQLQIWFKSWAQSTESEFEAGTISTHTIDTASAPGYVNLEPQDTAVDWNAGTMIDLDTYTVSGNLKLESFAGSELETANPENYGYIFGKVGSWPSHRQKAQSFQIISNSSATKIHIVKIELAKTGSPNNGTLAIKDDNNGSPGTTIVSATILASDVPAFDSETDNFAWVTLNLTTTFLSVNTIYWIHCSADSTPNNTYYYWQSNNLNAYTSGISYTSGSEDLSGVDFLFNADIFSTGTFTSQTLDYMATPGSTTWSSYGYFSASHTLLRNTTIWYQASSSTDTAWSNGSSYVNLQVSSATGASPSRIETYVPLRRYLKIRANFETDFSTKTPTLHKLFPGGYVKSQAHNFGTLVSAWDIFEISEGKPTNTYIDHYVKFATSEGGLATSSFTATPITAGNMIVNTTDNYWGQWLAQLSTKDPTITDDNFYLASVVMNYREGETEYTSPSSTYNGEDYILYFSTGDFKYNHYGTLIDVRNKIWPINKKYFAATAKSKRRWYASSSNSGQVFIDEEGNNFGGEAIEAFLETKNYDMNLRNNKKQLWYLWATGTKQSTGTLNIGYSIDNGTFVDKIIDVWGTGVYNKKIKLGQGLLGKNFKFRIKNFNEDENIKWNILDCFYSPKKLREN